MARTTSDERSTPRRLDAVITRLRAAYGRTEGHPHGQPVDELILTVLSQNTNDRNRDVAYARLTRRFDAWQAIADAPVDEIEEAIRPGGLAPTKARRLKAILGALGDGLDDLPDEPLEDARRRLCALPGVGRKTAACVLLFAFGLPDIPVDTHVYRVITRLGLVRRGASFDEAHDELLRLARRQDPYEVHMTLIRHGRRTCVARAPRCEQCPLLRLCPHGKARLQA